MRHQPELLSPRQIFCEPLVVRAGGHRRPLLAGRHAPTNSNEPTPPLLRRVEQMTETPRKAQRLLQQEKAETACRRPALRTALIPRDVPRNHSLLTGFFRELPQHHVRSL